MNGPLSLDALAETLARYSHAESADGDGSVYQRERLQALADAVCAHVAGDLLEIGCLNGSTTVLLAEVAAKHGRRVLAVDPWKIGTQNCKGGEYEIFCETTARLSSHIDVVRKSSQDPEAIAAIRGRPLAFAFVDGLHEYAACLLDIRACAHAGIIAVDDTKWSGDCMRAFIEGGGERRRLTSALWRESYIL